MNFQKVRYEELSGKQKEIFNFQKVAAQLADYGFNCIRLDDDWQGADFPRIPQRRRQDSQSSTQEPPQHLSEIRRQRSVGVLSTQW